MISNTITGHANESVTMESTNAGEKDDMHSATQPSLTSEKIDGQNDDNPQISPEETGTYWHLVNVHLQFYKDQDLWG